MAKRTRVGAPKAQGLYDPANERDACGVGFVCNVKGEKSHEIITRGIEVLSEDYIRTARAKGLKPSRVIGLHALRNAMIPVITVIGLQVGVLFAGAILTETIFSPPIRFTHSRRSGHRGVFFISFR